VLSIYNLWQYDFQLKLKLKAGENWWSVNCLSDHMRMQYLSCLLIWNSSIIFKWLTYPFVWLVMIFTSPLFKSDDVCFGLLIIVITNDWFDWFLLLNPTFSNISAIPWRPVLVVEEAGVPGENHWPWPKNL
jgi:hypothetical protein